jgi:hypothetical protein
MPAPCSYQFLYALLPISRAWVDAGKWGNAAELTRKMLGYSLFIWFLPSIEYQLEDSSFDKL